MNWNEVGSVVRRVEWMWLAGALLATFLAPICATIRWIGVLEATEDTRLPFRTALLAVMTANALNLVLPSKGGDAVKVLYLKTEAKATDTLGMVVIERILDIAMLGVLGIAGGISSELPWSVGLGAVLVSASILVFSLLHQSLKKGIPSWVPSTIENAITYSARHFSQWRCNPRAVSLALVGSFGSWMSCLLIAGCLVAGIHGTGRWSLIFAIMPAAILVGLLPLTISGMGTRDAAITFLLEGVLTVEESTLVALGYTLFAYWIYALVSLPFILGNKVSLLLPSKKD